MQEPQQREDREGSAGLRLRALLTERHAAFAQEMWALFEDTVAQLEEEVRHLRAENHRQMRILKGVQRRRARALRMKTQKANEELVTENSSDTEDDNCKLKRQSKEEDKSVRLDEEMLTENSSDQDDGVHPEADPRTENSSESGGDEDCESRKKLHQRPPEDGPLREAFVCSVCDKSFSHKSILKRHMFAHEESRAFECSECGSHFKTKNHLERHMEIHLRKRPSGDQALRQTTPDPSVQVRHAARPLPSHEEQPMCVPCNKTFSTKGNLMKHNRCFHDKKFSFKRKMQNMEFRHRHLACSACDKRFRFQSELLRHVKSAHGSVKSAHGSVKSAHGSVKSAHGSEKSAHGSVKSAHGSVKSAHGSVKSAHRSKKSIDGRQKSDDRGEKSDYMGEKSNDRREKSVDRREKSVDRGEKSDYMVEKSNDRREKSVDRREKSVDGGEKSDDRGEKSVDRGEKSDDRGESDDRNKKIHECETCHKCFRDKRYLTDHRRLHTGEKPYSCPVCAKAFTFRNNLYTHMKYHSGTFSRPSGADRI